MTTEPTPLRDPRGSIALVGAGPGAADLLTLRALERIRAADLICYDRLVDPAVLAHARPEAERIYVGKEVGRHAWPQERICALITAAARAGKRVVRLKSGDPSIFGRAAEELAAARAAGIAVEIVPGITAASAAAAALGRPLTEGGETDALVVATGMCRPGDDDPDWGALARAGCTVALYMAVGRLAEIREQMLASGVEADCEVEIVCAASTGRERVIRTVLGRLGAETQGVVAPAILLLRRPKRAAARLRCAG